MQSQLGIIYILLLICGLSSSLTTNDYYKDSSVSTSAVVQTNETTNFTNLPLTITNMKALSAGTRLNRYSITGGVLKLRQSNEAIYNFAIQRHSVGFSGSASIKFSINAPLRARALADIKEKYPNVDSDAIAPTNLILFDNTDLEPYDSSVTSTGTTVQLVLATNGQYTYGIVQFVRVKVDSSQTGTYTSTYSQLLLPYPFASSTGALNANAASESNVGTPGKYIIDFNETAPPCQCKERIKAMACHIAKQTLPSSFPAFCNKYNKKNQQESVTM